MHLQGALKKKFGLKYLRKHMLRSTAVSPVLREVTRSTHSGT
jgi:hypothetical protein